VDIFTGGGGAVNGLALVVVRSVPAEEPGPAALG
jgi:hypothetical protein